MSKAAIIIVSLILAMVLGLGGCTQPAPPTPSDGSVTIKPANSESASRIAELEARIRELEAENQRLLTENRELSSGLAKATNQLEGIESLVTSSEYTQILSKLPKIQNDASDLATFLSGLPDLPPPPPGLTIAQIDDAINKARHLRDILEKLPPPLPFAPAGWYELDEMKDEFIRMTEWMKGLEELPEFLNIVGDLDDLRYQEIAHLQNINAAMDDIKSILEEIRDASWR